MASRQTHPPAAGGASPSQRVQSPNFAQVVFDSTLHGMWTIGLDGCITSINRAAVEMFGYQSATQMVGQNSHALVHYRRSDGSHYPRVACPIYKGFQQGKPVHLVDEVLWRADGTSFQVDYHSVPIFAEGVITGAVVTFVDNSDVQKAARALAIKQLWLESTLDSIGDAVMTTDTRVDPLITFMNPMAEALTGWTLDEAAGKPLRDVCRLVDLVDHDKLLDVAAHVEAKGEQHADASQAILQSRQGEHYFVEQRVTCIRDRKGVVQGMVLVCHNITERFLAARRVVEQEMHLNLALEGAQMGTWEVNLATSCMHLSPQALRIFGESTPEWAAAEFLQQCVHVEDQSAARKAWAHAIASQHAYVDEFRIVRQDGAVRWVSLKGRLARRAGDDQRCLSGVVSDITDAVDVRLAMAETTRELGEEREKLARLVDNLNAERELRERFVVALTHDLRAPMTAAKMSAQLLKRKVQHDKAVQKLGDRIVDSVNRAERMVQDLLDANRLKAGHGIPITPTDCRLDDVIDKVTSELTHVHGDRFSIRRGTSSVSGHWDENGLQRIVENLASNAVKYGALDGVVTIAIDHDASGADISVHNEGPPMAPQERAVLFDPFRRLESAERSGQRGWGIGLTLVKGITEAHGGTVSVQSDAGAGTTFTVRLPYTREMQL